MNLGAVEKIAKAVLYEGYMLYPYRPSSVKNQQRWNFGVLCPPAYCEAQNGGESWSMLTECLVEGDSATQIEVRVRFLQLVARSVGQLTEPVKDLPGEVPEFKPVEKLELNGRVYHAWQEAIERDLVLPLYSPSVQAHAHEPFFLDSDKQFEHLRNASEEITGVLVRERKPISGVIELMAERVEDGLFKISVLVRNTTPLQGATACTRDEALLSSMASTHAVLGVQNGKFVSQTAPDDRFLAAAASCKNIGAWPVLVGEEGQRDTVLASPIILYDYPQIAPESAGDLFDGTEIDEILSLRIMTLTDDEKREMSQSDDRAREMLERTESMPMEQFMKLHGVLRSLRPLKREEIQ